MIKFLFIFVLSVVLLNAKYVTIFGSDALNEGNISIINNNLFVKDNVFVSAKSMIYNRNKKYILAKNKVYITYSDNSFVISKLATIYLDTKEMKLYPFFVFDSLSDGWISSIKAKKLNSKFNFTNVLASTCSINMPDWKIISSSGSYDRKDKWVTLYNPTFYIHNVPVAYLPYLGFSLEKTRRIGFLRPLFGYSVKEGFLYSQPFYIPFSPSSDLEIIPSIRTLRGKGIYSTYRFVDSNASKGRLKVGTFTDSKEYQDKFNLKNNKHYGIMFNYSHDHPFFDKDDFYLDVNYANDVDFFYLDSNNNSFKKGYFSNKTITSIANYIYKGDKNYFGIYNKYFIDTSKVSNSDTFQILPELQYHRYTDSYFFDKLISNVDLDIQNYYRVTGARYVKRSINVPLSYHFSFLKDYLQLNISEIFSGADLQDTANKTIANYNSLDTLADFYTNLSKEIFPSIYHNVDFHMTFFKNNKQHKSGSSEFIKPTQTQENVTFKLNQYIDAPNFSIKHNLSQTFYRDGKYSNLFNYLYAKYKNYYVSDNNQYSRALNRVYYNSATFGYDGGIFDIAWAHIYRYKSGRSYSIKTSLNTSKHHQVYAYYNYDYILKEVNSWYLGIKMNKKCWNYNIKFAQQKLPILTNSGASNIKQNTIYFEIEFNPIGGFEQSFMYKE